jgi:hypothetical protein
MKNRNVRLSTMVALFIAIVMGSTSCTDNQRARSFGGTETIKLLPNEEFVNITWKQDNLWVIVKDTVTGKFYAREKSSFGLMQGKVVIE